VPENERDRDDPGSVSPSRRYLITLHAASMDRMAPKTIALDQEAYDLLWRQKEQGESFSDVIKRLARKRRSFLDFAGAWKDIPKADLDRIRDFLRIGRQLERERND
jgi:predicted CopG family antitoxin